MFRACWVQPSRIIASSSHSSLHTSAVLHGQSSHQHVARAIRKANIENKEELRRIAQKNRTYFVLGTLRKERWERCRLARVLVDENELALNHNTQQTIGPVLLPKEFNFGVGESEKRLLFGALPVLTSMEGKDFTAAKETGEKDSTAAQVTGGKDSTAAQDTGNETPEYVSLGDITKAQKVWMANVAREHKKANLFAGVIDLRNANAAGIAYENRRRIIEAFSTSENPFDPGRSEVQAALLTYKIRKLWKHLTEFKRDLGNRRGLRMLVHQRAKILKYLKKVDQTRYEIVLKQLALERKSVEGELANI